MNKTTRAKETEVLRDGWGGRDYQLRTVVLSSALMLAQCNVQNINLTLKPHQRVQCP